MLKPVKMQRIRVIGLKDKEGEALKFLQNEGVLHINQMKAKGLEAGKPLADFEAVSNELLRMRGIRNALVAQKDAQNPTPLAIANPLATAAKIDIDREIVRMREENALMAKELENALKMGEAALRLANLDVEISALPKALDYHIISVKAENAEAVKSAVQKKARHCQTVEAQDGKIAGNTILLFAVKKGSDINSEILNAERLEWKYEGTAKRAIMKSRHMRDEIEETLRANEMRLREISSRNFRLVCALEEALSIEADRAQIANRFAESRECFYIDGWVQEKDYARVARKIEERFGKKVIAQRAQVPHTEEHGAHAHVEAADVPPTLLQNPKMAGPFQYLVEMLSLPQQDEFDPTLLIAFFLPIIYGMIVGDAGYALISLFLALLLMKISAPGGMLRAFSTMWGLCALPAFVFGILYDEYFGFSHKVLLGLKEPMYNAIVHRVENVQLLIVFSLLVGLIHLGFGFILGAINEWNHSKKHSAAKIGWLLVEIGGVFTVGGGMLHAFGAAETMAGAAVLAVGVLIIIWSEGVVGIFEIPGLASNIMSYARIAAVGVAGVILAEIINQLLLPDVKLLSTPAGMATFSVIGALYVVMHIFNTFIAMFESLIHGARLNVIEFYGKFYKGNGIRFLPFAAKRRYTVGEEKEQ